MSDSVRPHRRQPTRLLHPWHSPGKNTGVGCHFLLQCMKVKSLSRVRLFATPWTTPTRLLRPWDFPGKSTGVGCHCLLHYLVYMCQKTLKDFSGRNTLNIDFWLNNKDNIESNPRLRQNITLLVPLCPRLS